MEFIGRKNELEKLNKLYESNKFEMAVIYGRRRVGKSTLIQEFIKDRNAISFTALETSTAQNLALFTKSIVKSSYPKIKNPPTFVNFETAFDEIGEMAGNKRTVVVIDEYPYLAKSNSEISSMLQYYIDTIYRNTNMLLILCGSSMSFMENQVLGYQSPLYGRRTAQFKLEAFGYLEAAQFVEAYRPEEKAVMYGLTSGIPKYLECMDDALTMKENIIAVFLNKDGYLFEEPSNLLKQELREAAYYNAILDAIAGGASKVNEIATKVGKEKDSIMPYLNTLMSLCIVRKENAITEEKNKKKTLYSISDTMFQFWYKYIPSHMDLIIGEEQEYLYDSFIKNTLNDFMGRNFEEICKQYLRNKSKANELPFKVTRLGRWWGSNSNTKEMAEIDIVAFDDTQEHKAAIFCECKFRNELLGLKVLDDLQKNATLIYSEGQKYYILFSKSGFEKAVIDRAKESKNVLLVTLEDMYGTSSSCKHHSLEAKGSIQIVDSKIRMPMFAG